MKVPFTAGQVFVSPGFPIVRRGRPPLNGTVAMTRAEISQRKREKRSAEKPLKVLPPCPGLLPGPLTAQIANDSFVRRYIDNNFPDLKNIVRLRNRRIREQGYVEQASLHEHSIVSMLVGTAIDYRIRANFRSDIHRSDSIQKGLLVLQTLPEFRRVTMLGLELQQIETMENVWYRKRKENVSAKLIRSFRKFIAQARPQRRRLNALAEERLCRYSILFAYLDFIGRSPGANSALEIVIGYGSPNIKKMLGYIDARIVADVVSLSTLFSQHHADLISKSRKAFVGGTLAGSRDVGGADFDLIVDGCLMDVKATRKSCITTAHLRQLLGYWLLDYDDQFKIRSLAVCLIRHGHTEYFDICNDLMHGERSADKLRKTFRKELRKLRRDQQPFTRNLFYVGRN